MSLEAMTWVYTRAPIPAKTRKGEPSPGVLAAVLLCLADGYSEETGLAFRGIRNIAGRTRHDERTVRAAMRALEAYGLIRAAEDQSVVAAKVKRADQRPVGYELSLHLDNGGEHLHDGDSAKPGGRAAPSRPTSGGASDPLANGTGGRATPSRGGERSDTGGRAALRTQEEPKKEPKGGSPFGGTSLAAGREHATTPPPDPPVTEPPAAAPPATAPPTPDPEPEYCPRHPNGTDEPCWACARLREAREAAQQAQERTFAARSAQAHQDETQAFWAAIRACPDCDAQGYRLDNLRCRCSHEPGQAERNRQRMAEVRAELAAIKARKPAAQEDEVTA